jgi:hypothetical protein
MTITVLPSTGNSSKFHAITKNGEFNLALSFTLRTKIWKLTDAAAELRAAQEIIEAIVSRHDPALPFKELYILAEHNTQPTLQQTIQQIRKSGF